MDKKDIYDLKFIRIYDFGLIPKEYIESVIEGGRTSFTFEKLMEFAPLIVQSPREYLYAIADKDHAIKGYVWCTHNPLSESLDVTNIALDEEYRGDGQYLKILVPHLRELRKSLGISTTRWLTTRPEVYAKYGFAKTGQTMISENDDFDFEAFLEMTEEKVDG